MFTASGELSIKNIDKGNKYSYGVNSDVGGYNISDNSLKAETKRRLRNQKASGGSLMKTDFYKSLKRL